MSASCRWTPRSPRRRSPARSARRSSTAGSRRRAAPPSTAAAARASARSRRAGWRRGAWPGGPPRFAYQVWLCARSEPSAPAAIVRSIETARSAARCGRRRPARPTPCALSRPRAGAPAVDAHVLERAQLARQVLDVHARAAIDLRRVLAGQQRDPHAVTRSPLGMTTMPPSDTWKRARVGLRVDADLARPRRSHVLVHDRPPHDRVAAHLDPVHEDRVLDERVGVQVHERREDRAPHLPPETTTPAQTIESSA